MNTLKKRWIENRSLFYIVLGMAFFRTAIADWSPVPSRSMEPTIHPGDVLLINKTLLGPNLPFTEGRLLQLDQPQRGDIVTFTPPGKSDTYVKRVVGLPGDRVRMEGIQLVINDVPVALAVIDAGERSGVLRVMEQLGEHRHEFQIDLQRGMKEIEGEVLVPADSFFVMGDFRNDSEDSRYFGVVHQDRMIGKVTRLALSVASERNWLKAPFTALQ